METLKHWFLEDPLYLYVLSALAWGLLVVNWRAQRTRRSAWLLLVPPALAVCLFALARVAVTDRERIIAAAEEIARDFESGSVAAAEKYLDESFSGPYGTRQQALAEARRQIERHAPRVVELSAVEVTVQGGRADMSVITVVEPSSGMLSGQRVPCRWDVHWVKVTEGDRKVWRIRSVSRPR